MKSFRLACLTLALSLTAAAGCDGQRSSTTKPTEGPATHAEDSPAMSRNEARDDHQHHGGMPHRFDDAEKWARQFDNPERDAWQKPDQVLEFLGLQPTDRVADIGAGTGYFSVRFARALPEGEVVAIDLEPDMVKYLDERASREGLDNHVARLAAADDPGLEAPVDLLFMCNVFHHLQDRRAYFERVASALEPGGRVVIVDFQPDAPPGTPGPPAKHRVSIDQIAQELSGTFELTRSDTDALPYQYIVEFKAKE